MYFSVIVPIYGVEKYIHRCIDSILAEDFQDMEIILVDDGSEDNCPDICDRYAESDSRVKVIHKKNGGLVSARQEGVSAASGQYIINVDGDDSIQPGYFDEAYKLCQRYSPDVISFGIYYDYGDKKVFDPEPLECGLYSGNRLREIHAKMLLTPDMKHMHYFLWAKVFKRQTIINCQLEVDRRISMGEDVTCLLPVYMKAKSVYISDTAVYNCRCREGSMSRSYKQEHFDDIKLGVSHLILKGRENRLDDNFYRSVYRYAAFMFFVVFASGAEQGERKMCSYAESVFDGCFSQAFESANFSNVTFKSKIAVFLLGKKKFKTAYYFLRLCGKLKGKG